MFLSDSSGSGRGFSARVASQPDRDLNLTATTRRHHHGGARGVEKDGEGEEDPDDEQEEEEEREEEDDHNDVKVESRKNKTVNFRKVLWGYQLKKCTIIINN